MDKPMTEISMEIEILRDQLHKRVAKVGIAHPDILRLSRKLDRLINRYQHYSRSLRTCRE